ncbi:unnamed protein product [Leptosia nina]|uniref:C2H2-type domain-containing protein n=1 Tax=Leptosia nina TaxID=320188 RepID=A0AAV1J1X0_9NEOP
MDVKLSILKANSLGHYYEVLTGKNITDKHIRKVDRESLCLTSYLSQSDVNSRIKVDYDTNIYETKLGFENNSNDAIDFDWPSDDDSKIKTEKIVIDIPIKKEIEVKSERKRKLKQPKPQRWIRKKKDPQGLGGVKKRNRPKALPATVTNTVDDKELFKHVAVVNLTVEEQFEEVQRRKESSNYQNSFYKCEICYKGFVDVRAWENHNKQHSEGVVECDICKLRFRSKHILSKHVKYHSTKYHCLQCPYVSRGSSQAKLHILWHRGVTYDCEHCGEKFRQRMSFITHLRMKHASDWVCGVCGNTFVSQLGLLQHKSQRHVDLDKTDLEDNPEAPFCDMCNVKFASPEAFKRHLVTARKHISMSENKYGCRECGESYKTARELRAHTKSRRECLRKPNYSTSPVTKNGDPKSWPMNCPHCGKEIANAHSYWWHFKSSHPDKEYYAGTDSICDVCGKGFPKRMLGAHMANHSKRYANDNESEEKCEICGKTFSKRSSLYSHRRTHSEARPHVCTVCGMGFKAKSVLLRHGLVHTGEKPYTCEICGKSFSQSNTCQQHVRTVHHKLPPLYISRSKRERMMRRQCNE